MTVTTGRLVQRDLVEPVEWMGEQGRFLLRAEDTGGLYTFMEISTSPGGGPPMHIHEREDEAFLILEGTYDVRLDGDLYHATPGSLVYGPRGVPHQFRNTGDTRGKMLVIVTPGGVENFFEGLSKVMAKGFPPDWDEMQELAERHHITPVDLDLSYGDDA